MATAFGHSNKNFDLLLFHNTSSLYEWYEFYIIASSTHKLRAQTLKSAFVRKTSHNRYGFTFILISNRRFLGVEDVTTVSDLLYTSAYGEENAMIKVSQHGQFPCGEEVQDIADTCRLADLSQECLAYCKQVGHFSRVTATGDNRLDLLMRSGLDEMDAPDWFLSDCRLQGHDQSRKCWKRVVAESGFCYMTDLSKHLHFTVQRDLAKSQGSSS